MSVTVAKNSGFCQGVKKAVDVAMNINTPAYVYGELIHNEVVLDKLRARGVVTVDNLNDFKGDKIIIRSHGVGKDIYDRLKSNNIE